MGRDLLPEIIASNGQLDRLILRFADHDLHFLAVADRFVIDRCDPVAFLKARFRSGHCRIDAADNHWFGSRVRSHVEKSTGLAIFRNLGRLDL